MRSPTSAKYRSKIAILNLTTEQDSYFLWFLISVITAHSMIMNVNKSPYVTIIPPPSQDAKRMEARPPTALLSILYYQWPCNASLLYFLQSTIAIFIFHIAKMLSHYKAGQHFHLFINFTKPYCQSAGYTKYAYRALPGLWK